MFDSKTVFILGAGASWHYNYPTGEDLVKKVIDKANKIIGCFNNDKRNGQIDTSDVPIFFKERYSDPIRFFDPVLFFLNDFVERLTHVDPPVIDYFLGWNKDLQDIGRLMIAWVMLDRERELNARGNVNRQRMYDESPFFEEGKVKDIKKFKDNWYRFVLYKIVSGCKEASDLEAYNNVKFITFNYDVSLETELYKGLQAIQFLRLENGEIDKFMQGRFIHMYGQIRTNPFSKFEFIKASPADKRIKNYKEILDMAYAASKGIRTIDSHDKDDKEAIRHAQAAIEWAERVYILGYGFDGSNSARLDLEGLLSIKALRKKAGDLRETEGTVKKKIYFTNFEDRNAVNKRAARLFTGDSNSFLPDRSAILKETGNAGFHRWSFFCEKSIRNVYDALERDFDFI